VRSIFRCFIGLLGHIPKAIRNLFVGKKNEELSQMIKIALESIKKVKCKVENI
jgi:hypothetical protein